MAAFTDLYQRRQTRRGSLLNALLAIAAFTLPGLGQAGQVTAAVAANFTATMEELASAFRLQTGHDIRISYGSTGKLFAQIANGAPFDLFMAADSHRPELLESRGTAVSGTRFTYARGKLAFWSPAPDTFADPEHFLASPDIGRIAIANPKTAPYGLAARQTLTELGLWDTLKPRLVRGESIAQTFQFVATGNATAGFVALSQILTRDDQGGTLWLVPQSYYTPIEQQAILLKRGESNDAARAWLAFMRSEPALVIIRRYGYDTDQ